MRSFGCSQHHASTPGCVNQQHGRVRPARTRTLRSRSYVQEFSELLGDTAGDPGHWNYAPEWFGTQASGWGRNAGDIVFYGQSKHGNGLVRSDVGHRPGSFHLTHICAGSGNISPSSTLAQHCSGQHTGMPSHSGTTEAINARVMLHA